MLEQEESRLCAACGASNAASATFCGVCGVVFQGAAPLREALLPEAPTSNDGPEAPPALPGEAPLPPPLESTIPQERPAEAPTEAVAQKRCSWCSEMNPQAAAVCEKCGAHFPVPEQDEAFRRAAEQRLLAEEAAVEMLRHRRLRGNGWGFWRRRGF